MLVNVFKEWPYLRECLGFQSVLGVGWTIVPPRLRNELISLFFNGGFGGGVLDAEK